ncbi:MAG: 30S ribosomal protein S13 [Bdellovibrionaceae bacterium]|nr:30S ribosomal protein S13 [Pseudobdellovibrionaceae bacterium]
MARISGIDIPNNKRVEVSLTYIYGIGRKRAMDICKAMGFSPSKRAHELNDEDVAKIRDYIQDNYKIEGDLRREISMAIKRLTDLGTYRGLRHKKGLPVRGQRTKSNARTRKGPRKTVANKKKAVM